MIKHIVLYKMKNYCEKSLDSMREIFYSMKSRVPEALSIEVNADELRSARSYDIMLTVTLESFDALNRYQEHPYHKNTVKPTVQALVEASVSMDFNV